MDLSVPYSRDHEKVDKVLQELKRLKWGAAAIDVTVNADLGAEQASQSDNEQEEVGDQNPLNELRIPTREALAELLGTFPTVPLSERDPDREGLDLYSRLTIRFSSVGGLHKALKDPRCNLFDVVAVEPVNGKALQVALGALEPPRFDLIKFDIEQGFVAKIGRLDMIKLRSHKIFIEVNYTVANTMNDRMRREALVTSHQAMQFVSRGHLGAKGRFGNVLLTSGRAMAHHRRRPNEVVELGVRLGIPPSVVQTSVTLSCQAVLECAEKRRRALLG